MKDGLKDKVTFPTDKTVLAKMTVDQLVEKLRAAVTPEAAAASEGVSEEKLVVCQKKIASLEELLESKGKEAAQAKEQVESFEFKLEASNDRFDWLVERVVDLADKLGEKDWAPHLKSIKTRSQTLRRQTRSAARWTAEGGEHLEETLVTNLDVFAEH